MALQLLPLLRLETRRNGVAAFKQFAHQAFTEADCDCRDRVSDLDLARALSHSHSSKQRPVVFHNQHKREGTTYESWREPHSDLCTRSFFKSLVPSSIYASRTHTNGSSIQNRKT